MVTPVVRKPWFRLAIGGTFYDVANSYTQTEALTDAVTRVLDVEVVATPTLSTGQTIAFHAVDLEASESIPQFSGALNTIVASRYPNKVNLICTGPLAKLRRTRISDLDLSGMTELQAVKLILSYCGVSYQDANIGGNSYILGQRVPILWRAGQSGAEIIAELNRVFGYALIETGGGIISRFSYDLVPNLANSAMTFHAGNSAFYYDGARNRGDIDSIQNVWDVTGASYECAGSTTDETCTCAIYAHAEAPHPKLGSGVYVSPQTFSSEIIQDANLARAIAERQMRWYNREPDSVTIESWNTPLLAPGMVIDIIDSVYGMNFSTATPYVITRLDRRGDDMTIQAIGGAAGNIGTVTSGVEKQCNDLSTNLPDPPDLGGFPGFPGSPGFPTMPGIDPAPIAEPPVPDEPPQPALEGPEGCFEFFTEGNEIGWDIPTGSTWNILGSKLTVTNSGPGAFKSSLPGLTIEPGRSWHIAGSFKILQAGVAIGVGVGQFGTTFDMHGAYADSVFGAINRKEAEVFLTSDGNDPTVSVGTTYGFQIRWDQETKIFSMLGHGTGLSITKSNMDELWLTPTHPIINVNVTSGGDFELPAAEFTTFYVCYDDDPCTEQCAEFEDDTEAKEFCMFDCQEEVSVELACSDWEDSLGQGSINCPIIGDDTTIVFHSEGNDCNDNNYTGAVYTTPVATLGDNFTITYVAKCGGGCFCNAPVGEMCDPEFGFGTEPHAWDSPKAYHWFYDWFDSPSTEYGLFWFGGLDFATNQSSSNFGRPPSVPHWGGSADPFTVRITYLSDSETGKLELWQDGEKRWAVEVPDVWAWGGNLYNPSDSDPVYPIVRTNCGDVTLLKMSVKVW